MSEFKNAHILIVDDQPINLAGLKKIVRQDNSARISLASGGNEAIEIIKRDPPDLVLTDILMPEMDGFELCLRIKNGQGTAAIPVLFITSLNDPESIERGFDCGGIDYILKPFNPREVRSRVRAHLGLKLSNDKVIALSSWKDRLISILSHDLRGPVGNLSMFTEIMEKESKDTSPYFSDILKKIKTSITSASNLMENLLEWASIQRTGVSMNPELFKLKNFFTACIAAYSSYAADKNLTLVSGYNDDDEITADRRITETVLRNLVLNAIKFTSAGQITIDAMVSDASVTITVSDTGVGIDPSKLSNIFEIKKASETKGTMNEKGSGIGLMICNDLAAVCGGKISVESSTGLGSKFSFTFPELSGNKGNDF